MNRAEIIGEFAKGRHCSQIVCGEFADETGYDIEETDKATEHLGGGLLMGHTCGCVAGGLVALGLMGISREESMEFEKRFKDRFGSCICFELLDHQTPAQAREAGRLLELCPGYVEGAIEIIQEMIQ